MWGRQAKTGEPVAQEIEHKFLVRNDGWRETAGPGEEIRQGYLAGGPRSSVRIRRASDGAWLNIKGATLGVSRQEFEYPIPVEDAERMLESLCEGPLIEKTRFRVAHGHHVWEVDVFHGENAGLVVAELELAREGEPFARPPWVGEEVSRDPRYYNVSLVRHPYREWRS